MRRLGAVCLLSAALAGCAATPPEEDPVQIKLGELDGRLARLERSNQGVVDMAQRLDAIQAELRALRGRFEELENGTESLRKQQRDLYSDLDKRINTGAGAAPGAAGGPAAAGEQTAYNQAFELLKGGDYAGAIAGFQAFLAAYPNSAVGDNAQYWLGEAYYVTRDFANAGPAFRTVLERWPASRKAPDALVKLGFTQHEQKRTAEARATLNDVVKRFPDSEAAKLAAERLRRLPPNGR